MSRPIGRFCAALLGICCALWLPATAAFADQPGGVLGGPALGTSGVATPVGMPAPPQVAAASWVVADLDTGTVLAARNPHGRYLPASTLKVLTALTLIPRLNPQKLVHPSWSDVNVDGTKVGLVPQLRYSVSQLFTSLLVVSANDAANTLADAAGGMAKTVAWMNDEATYLRAFDTTARDPSGLDAPGQRTSAYDLALIGRAALQLPEFRHYVAIRRAYIPAPAPQRRMEIDTHNRLLGDYPGAFGVKNGYTVAAQATFIGAAARGGHRLIVTLMHAEPRVWVDAASLLDWGFRVDGHTTGVGSLVDPLPPHAAVPLSAKVDAGAHSALTHAAESQTLLHRQPSPVVGAAVAMLGIAVGLFTLRVRNRRTWSY